MSEKDEAVTEEKLEFNVMPGADLPSEEDEAPALDLSFDTPEPEPEVAEEEEEVAAEAEEEEPVEEPEETVAEEEPEEEAEPEPETEEELPLAAEKSSNKKMVPKARLDEVLAKQKALQKQLDEVNAANEKSDEAPEAYDFDAKEDEYQNLMLDGENAKATALRREIRQAERAMFQYEMRQEMAQNISADRQMTALQQAAAAMEEAYPVFDQNSESYSEDLTNEVVELRDAFIARNYDAVDALSKAVQYVVKSNDLDQPADSAPSLAGKSSPVDEVAKKRAQVSKKLKAAEAQPPELPGESSSNHGEKGIDLSTLTEEEFDALPEATLKRLRGDIL